MWVNMNTRILDYVIRGYYRCNAIPILLAMHMRHLNFSFLTLSSTVEKCLCIRFVSLSVSCLSVCPSSNSRKYSSNVLKLKYVIHI